LRLPAGDHYVMSFALCHGGMEPDHSGGDMVFPCEDQENATFYLDGREGMVNLGRLVSD